MLKKSAGFTAIEMLVVLGIVGILAAIVFASFSGARATARDGERESELGQYVLAFKLYAEQNAGQYPVCDEGVFFTKSGIVAAGASCTDLVAIQTFMNQFFGTPPYDPKDDGSASPVYTYFYDSRHDACDSIIKPPILAVKEMENTPPIDPLSICSGLGGDGGLNNASHPYVIRLDQTY